MEGSLTRTRAADAYVAPGAHLFGDVRMASGSSVFHGTTVRAELDHVEIGLQANVQDNCVIEATPGYPVVIGARVSVGHNARVYGATIEASALIAIGATVMSGAHVGTNAIVAATPRSMRPQHGRDRGSRLRCWRTAKRPLETPRFA